MDRRSLLHFDELTYGIYAVPPPDLPKPKPRYLGRVNVGAREAWERAMAG